MSQFFSSVQKYIHILNTIFYLLIAINVLAFGFSSDGWIILTILSCILGASLSLTGYLIESYIKPKRKLHEENKKMEEEKNNLMDDLEKEAVRKKEENRLQQN